jgi:hypothetical protein
MIQTARKANHGGGLVNVNLSAQRRPLRAGWIGAAVCDPRSHQRRAGPGNGCCRCRNRGDHSCALRLDFITTYLIRLLDRRPNSDYAVSATARPGGERVAGFRGAVSLAAALAVPQVVASGEPFPAATSSSSSPPESLWSPWCCKDCCYRAWCAGPDYPVTQQLMKNAASLKPALQRKHSPS